MRIFFICQRVPYPPNRGDKITTFHEIRHLSREHKVDVFCPGDGLEDLANIPGLKCYATSVSTGPVSHWGARFRAGKAVLGGAPLSKAAYNNEKLHAVIKHKYSELRPDLIIVYSSNVAQYAEHFPETPKIMQFAELDSAKWAQYAKRSAVPLKWIYQMEQRRLAEYENYIARSFSHSLVCTEAELRDFQQQIPNVPVSVVGNGVDLEFFRPGGTVKKAGSIVFTGVMNYLPNVDAVTWFAQEVLPLIQAEVSDAHFVICGGHPNSAVHRLAGRKGVVVTGGVPDTRPYLDSAEVFVAPLRLARGIQNKVLEALAMGLPCVSSLAAFRGTVLSQGEGIVATDDPREFADSVVHLLKCSSCRTAMATKARLAAERHYSWGTQLRALDAVIAAVTARTIVS